MPDAPDRIINISTGLIAGAEVRTNLTQEVIVTTRDKVELALRRTLPKYTSTEQLLAWTSLLVGLVLTLITADFRKTFGVPATGWKTAFTILAIGVAALVVREFYRWLNRPDLKGVIAEIVEASD